MTIKQLGGVFGRNPTFNDVTIEGQLTFDGDIDVGSDLKIDGDLNVIGTTTLDGPVDVNMGNNIVDFSSGDSGYIKIQHVSRGGDYRLKVNGATADYLDVQNGASQKLIRMAATGDVTIYDNLVIGTSGKGIDFSATAGTGTSELLDDYEEGTWTPTVRGTTAGTYTLADVSAYYTKIGNQVTITAYFGFSAASGGTSLMRIGNIPFTYKGFSVFQGAVRHGNVTLTTSDADVTVGPRFFNLGTASTDLFLFESTGGSASVGVQISGISTSSTVAFTATYTVE